MAAAIVVPACNDDDDNNSDDNQQQSLDIDAQVADVQLEVVSDKMLKAEEMADEIFGTSGANGGGDESLEKYRAAFLKRQQELAEKLAAENGSNGFATGWRSINYK